MTVGTYSKALTFHRDEPLSGVNVTRAVTPSYVPERLAA